MKQPTLLITGCSTGIGHACALGMAARGWRVFATARKSADVAVLQAQGLEALQLDLNDSDSINAAVNAVLHHAGGTLDALIELESFRSSCNASNP